MVHVCRIIKSSCIIKKINIAYANIVDYDAVMIFKLLQINWWNYKWVWHFTVVVVSRV